MSDEYQVNETGLNPELRRLEVELSRVPLPDSGVDRDWVLFESGKAAALAAMDRKQVQSILPPVRNAPKSFWPSVSVASAAAAVLLGVLLLQEMQSVSKLNDQLAKVERVTTDGSSVREGQALVGELEQSDSRVILSVNDGVPNDDGVQNESRQPDLDSGWRSVDLAERVHNWPRGQVMTTGLVLPGSRPPVRLVPDVFQGEPDYVAPASVRPRKNHREMIHELLSEFEMSGA